MILKTVPDLLASGEITCADLNKYSNMFFQLQTGDIVPFSAISIDGQVSDYKPACTYGAKCYRKNKDHIREIFSSKRRSHVGQWYRNLITKFL